MHRRDVHADAGHTVSIYNAATYLLYATNTFTYEGASLIRILLVSFHFAKI